MRILDLLIILLLFAVLGFGGYLFLTNLPSEPVEYDEFYANISAGVTSTGDQFYPNMRYRSREISYSIEDVCSVKKADDVKKAFEILEDATSLSFYPSRDAEIQILCSEIAPEPTEKGHFVAGEGGPSEVINSTNFNVILSGKVSLFRNDKCETPQIALHEILHALGFDHNNNSQSIMFPVTNCNQELDEYIVKDINEIYSIDSKADIAIEKVSADKAGRYIDFEITISNFGLQDVRNSTLAVFADSEKIKDFDIGALEIGTKRILTVKNVRVPRTFSNIIFEVQTDDGEISKENNLAEIGVSNS